jgi:hypothetical protein
MMDLRLSRGPDDLRKLSKDLRNVGNAKEIRKRLTKGLREGTKPAQANVRKAALGLPAKGPKHTGLRKRMAAATGIQTRLRGSQVGVLVKVSRRKMGDQASLVSQSDTPGHWRHPVYGQPGVWVTQTWKRGWFEEANKKAAGPVRAAIRDVLNEIERELSN